MIDRRRLSKLPQPLIIAAHDKLQWAGDMAFPFAQEPNFLYLTGLNEAGWLFVLHEDTPYLIGPEVSEHERLFDGEMQHDAIREQTGVDALLDATQGDELMTRIAQASPTVYSLGEDPNKEYFSFTENPARERLWNALTEKFDKVEDTRKVLKRQRAIKTEQEIAHIRRAVHTTVDAFKKIQQESYDFEYEVEAVLNSEFRKAGDEGHAYAPIVAGGANACTLHYGSNSQALEKGSLVLIDAGAKSHGYAADITRTYAVGEVSARQRAVHAAVEKAHHQIIALIKPGLPLTQYSDEVDTIMTDALKSLGLHEEPSDYRKYFPHAISHGLGIDVHDSLGGYKELQPGMVLTVEPGIYIPEEEIGVRIEDDILVTKDGYENLSADLPTSL